MAILLALASMGGYIAYDVLKGRESNPNYRTLQEQTFRPNFVSDEIDESKFADLLKVYC